MPDELFDELTAVRTQALAQAAASLRAEDLTASAEVMLADRWARGVISTTDMRDLVRRLYRAG